jgi:hypothetical protein
MSIIWKIRRTEVKWFDWKTVIRKIFEFDEKLIF